MKNFERINESNIEKGTPIQTIHIGDNHSFIINNKNKVFFWGMNDQGQCGENIMGKIK